MSGCESMLILELFKHKDAEIARLDKQQESMRDAITALANYIVSLREYLESREIEVPKPNFSRLDGLWGHDN